MAATVKTNETHEQLYKDLCELMAKHTGNMQPIEQLAIAANIVGKMIALQDQRRYNVQQLMDVVSANIEAGNKAVIDQINATSAATFERIQ